VAQAGNFTVTPSSVTLGTGQAGNYSFSYVGATHTVNKAQLVIAAQANTKVFDGNVSATAVPLVSGLLGTDTVSDLSQVYASPSVGSSKAVVVQSFRVSDRNGGANYQTTLLQNGSGVINALPAVLAVSETGLDPSRSPPTPPRLLPIGTTGAIGQATGETTVAASGTAGGAAGGGSTGFTGTPGATAGATGAVAATPGVTVTTVTTPGQASTGLIVVNVPQGTAASGVGLVIPLPESVIAPANANADSGEVAVTLNNNQELPGWIRYDRASQALVTGAVPSGALPISVAVTVRGLRSVIEVSESQNR
jgi:hypothetical protein